MVDPAQGIDRVCDVLLKGAEIEAVTERPYEAVSGEYRRLDAAGCVVAPGFVDIHAHLREPGFEHKETIASGTAAAAKGGFTTVCAMPNTEPVQDSGSVISDLVRRARASGVVRVLPIGAITTGRKGEKLAEMAEMAEAGAIGFSDDGDPVGDPHLMRQALAYAGGLDLPIMNHCEEKSLTRNAQMHEGDVASRLGLGGWPSEGEAAMVARDISLLRAVGGRLHVCHLSTREAVAHVRAAKSEGLAVTAEVTPHHLTLTEEWVLGNGGDASGPVGARAYDTNTKVNPPLRSEDDRAAVVEALGEGVIDVIATDHAPHAETDKVCTYEEAAFGISGLETALASCLSLVHAGSIGLDTLVRRLSLAPAELLRLQAGALRPGFAGDITVFDPDVEWKVDPLKFLSKGRNTPLTGVSLRGQVIWTICAGRVVFARDAVAEGAGASIDR